MLKNYFKIAFRNFTQNKSFSTINIGGLAIGLTCFLLIFIYVMDEFSYDKFHNNSDQVFRVMEHQTFNDGNIFTTTSTPSLLSPVLKEEIPEIEYAATYTWNVNNLFTRNGESFKENGIYARPDLFKILTINLTEGTKENILDNPNSIVISQGLAKKYYGDENPLGNFLIINENDVYTVDGVFENLPTNSSLQFDYVMAFEDFMRENQWTLDWGNQGPRTILTLKNGADEQPVESKIKDFVKQRVEGTNIELFLYPFADLYLYGNFENGEVAGGRIEYVRIFSIIALFVVLIACINFMNLSTSRSVKRAKEIGVRKSLGANKSSLITQHICESVIIAYLAMLLSLLLVELFMPGFSNLIGREISFNYLEPRMLLLYACIALITGLIAGSYPALYLSSFQTVKVLKGHLRSTFGEVFVRKGLVIFQFALSVILIVSTLVIYNQIDFILNKNLGYKNEHLIYFRVEGELRQNWETFREVALANPDVSDISRSNHIFMGRNTSTSNVNWPGKAEDDIVMFEAVRTDYDLIETMGFEIIAGRSFSRDYGSDSTKVIINQAAAVVMGMENPVGQSLSVWGNDWQIIGVLKDFHYQNLRHEVEPMFMVLSPEDALAGFARLESGQISNALQELEGIYKEFNPAYPFEYTFMDSQYADMYKSEVRTASLAKYFGVFAILISCLGLFGLSVFTAEERTKEIGIRKVLGASVSGLAWLLSKEFTRLVMIAFFIAAPISWMVMNNWLQDFAYRIEIGPVIFMLAGGVITLIAVLTVSWQSIKAALMNPIESLRNE